MDYADEVAANFGGTIADLWESHETGPAMSVFLWAATCMFHPWLIIHSKCADDSVAVLHQDISSSPS